MDATKVIGGQAAPRLDARAEPVVECIDPIWPLWNVLDLTPEGRGKSWHPQLTY